MDFIGEDQIENAKLRAYENFNKDAENAYKDWLETQFTKILILKEQIRKIEKDAYSASVTDFYKERWDGTDYGRK